MLRMLMATTAAFAETIKIGLLVTQEEDFTVAGNDVIRPSRDTPDCSKL